jgi:uncharacterized membrane protein YuzA (DUF378 family)
VPVPPLVTGRMRYLLLVVALLAIAALAGRWPAARRALLVLIALAALYAVLKMTGVIEALAPDRDGVL